MMTRNIRMLLAYDGTDFHGWQKQPGFRTVQDTLEQATGKRIVIEAKADVGLDHVEFECHDQEARQVTFLPSVATASQPMPEPAPANS